MKKRVCFLFILLGLSLIVSLGYSVPAYEDFSSYVEFDPNEHITVTTNEITHVSPRNEDAWVYKNFTEDHFENFTHNVDIKSNLAWGYGAVWQLSNDIQDVLWLRQNGKTFLNVGVYEWSAPTEPSLVLEETYLGDTYQQKWFGIQADTWYYLVIQKSGTNFTCKVYSDSARTNLLTTLSLTLQANHKFKCLFGCCTLDSGHVNAITNNIKNLHIGEEWTVTFYNNTGGLFRVNNMTMVNGTSKNYVNNTVLELVSIPKNASYVFSLFEWNNTNSTTNPHNLTLLSDLTVWCIFDETPKSRLAVGLLFGAILGLVIGLVIALGLSKR